MQENTNNLIKLKTPPSTDIKYYNVRILKNFVSYLKLRAGWTNQDIDNLFEFCGLHSSILESDDNWFSQKEADTFYYRVLDLTKDPDIAYKVGAFTLTDASKGIPGKLISIFLNPKLAYKNISSIASQYNKGLKLVPVKSGSKKAILRGTMVNRCHESPYQCANRIGMLETTPTLFNCWGVSTQHPKCLHRGDEYCEYIISWKEPWVNSASKFGFIGWAFTTGLLWYLKGALNTEVIGFSATLGLFIFSTIREIGTGLVKKALNDQNLAMKESLHVLDRRHQEKQVLQNVMRITTEVMKTEELCNLSTKLIHEQMGYDRIILMLTSKDKAHLDVKATYGFPKEIEKKLLSTSFNIRADNEAGHFIKVVNTKNPVLVRDLQNNIKDLSKRSQELAKILGTDSFVAVPMLFDNEVIGVLAIENGKNSRSLSMEDLQATSRLAEHLAISISNAKNFQTVNDAKELFEKYVPSEMRMENILESNALSVIEKKELSIMFLDIVGFSSISENLPPENVAKMLSIVIDFIQNLVNAEGGRINKIMGDGMLIYFDPAKSNALSAGLNILENLKELNTKLRNEGFQNIALRIGVHKGTCTLGNIGSKQRLDYTLVGSAVNTASRIESFAKEYGKNHLCFSESLLSEASELNYEHCGEVLLKGFEKPTRIFLLKSSASVFLKAA